MRYEVGDVVEFDVPRVHNEQTERTRGRVTKRTTEVEVLVGSQTFRKDDFELCLIMREGSWRTDAAGCIRQWLDTAWDSDTTRIQQRYDAMRRALEYVIDVYEARLCDDGDCACSSCITAHGEMSDMLKALQVG